MPDPPPRVALFTAPGTPLEIRSVEVPEPARGEVLVEVLACTLCGSDLHTYEGRRAGPTPTILGHEILGRIAAFGPDAPRSDLSGTPLRLGDRVTWAVVASCGSCRLCRCGIPQKCERMIKYGHDRYEGIPRGGLADVCRLAPGTAIARVPDSIPNPVACPASCAAATAAAAIRAAGPIRDAVVLVQGAGMLGLNLIAMARAEGAAVVLVTDLDPTRLERSAAFGAAHAAMPGDLARVVRQVAGPHGVDVAFEVTGAPIAFEAGLTLVRPGGTYVLIGAVYPAPPVSLAIETIVRRHLTIRGIHNYAPEDLSAALRVLEASSPLPFADLVESWFPLEHADAAFRHAVDTRPFRVGVSAGIR